MKNTFNRGKKGKPRSHRTVVIARLNTWQDKTLRTYLVEHNPSVPIPISSHALIVAVARDVLAYEQTNTTD